MNYFVCVNCLRYFVSKCPSELDAFMGEGSPFSARCEMCGNFERFIWRSIQPNPADRIAIRDAYYKAKNLREHRTSCHSGSECGCSTTHKPVAAFPAISTQFPGDSNS